MLRKVIVFFFTILIFSSFANKSFASTLFQDNFNDNDISDWSEVRNSCKYNGSKANWEVNNGMVGIKIDGPGCVTELIPSSFKLIDGDDYYYSFDMSFPTTTSSDRNVIFKYKDQSNWYDLKFYGESLEFQKLISPSYYQLQTTSYPFQANNTYHFDIYYSTTKIIVNINDQKVWELNESTPFIGNTTIGLQASVGANPTSEVWFDNIKVTDAPPFNELDVPLIKQFSAPWNNLVYDFANNWSPSNPTIGTWGCAITSATMILQYNGFHKLPNGTQLDPGSLNSWLKQQPDGYTRNGLLNWISLSRLSRLAKDINNLNFDALEFSRTNFSLNTLEQNIQNGIPVILEEPGHFIVAKGITNTSFSINDPYFDRNYLSDYGNYFQSTRIYTPSNTDLSYVMIVADPNVELKFTNSIFEEKGDSHLEGPIENEGLSNDIQPQIFYLQHPTDSNYYLEIKSNQNTKYKFEIYFYDEEGNVKIYNIFGLVGQGNSDFFLITYNHDNSNTSSISKSSSINNFKKDLTALLLFSDFRNKGIYTSIMSKLDSFEKAKNNSTKANILVAIQSELKSQLNKGLNQNAYDIITENLNSL